MILTSAAAKSNKKRALSGKLYLPGNSFACGGLTLAPQSTADFHTNKNTRANL